MTVDKALKQLLAASAAFAVLATSVGYVDDWLYTRAEAVALTARLERAEYDVTETTVKLDSKLDVMNTQLLRIHRDIGRLLERRQYRDLDDQASTFAPTGTFRAR